VEESLNFTFSYDRIVDSLIMPVQIRKSQNCNNRFKQYYAIWDTGCNFLTVSPLVIKECGLIPSGDMFINLKEQQYKKAYKVDIKFGESQKIINNLIATENTVDHEPILLNGKEIKIDILLGMSIINLTDFLITNFNNQTILSFRIPSKGFDDFVEIAKIKRNLK
jgi:hypothetical protein